MGAKESWAHGTYRGGDLGVSRDNKEGKERKEKAKKVLRNLELYCMNPPSVVLLIQCITALQPLIYYS